MSAVPSATFLHLNHCNSFNHYHASQADAKRREGMKEGREERNYTPSGKKKKECWEKPQKCTCMSNVLVFFQA